VFGIRRGFWLKAIAFPEQGFLLFCNREIHCLFILKTNKYAVYCLSKNLFGKILLRIKIKKASTIIALAFSFT
jgi:hypothetical protein